MMKSGLALVLVLVSCTTAQEMFGRSTACAQSCPATSKFQYQIGMVHVFDYHVSAKFLSGTREPQLGVSARAHITVASKCEMILAMSHVRLADSADHDKDFSADLIKNPVRFAFLDGRVVSVCPADDEPRWALNFKRGVLSTFQNSMDNFDSTKIEWVKETDVNGLCTSNYTSVQQDKVMYNITRSRATTCIAPDAAPTNSIMTSVVQMIPMLHTEQKCLQMISGGSLKEAVCKENVRMPWDSNDELPVASLTTSLKLVYQFKADFVVIPNYQATRLSLALQWEDTSDDLAPPDWLGQALDMIKSLKDEAPSPALFYRLSSLLKDFNYSQLNDLFIKVSPKLWPVAQMAVSKLGTESSMKLVLDFLNYDALSMSQIQDISKTLFKYYDVSPAMIDIMEKIMTHSEVNEDKLLTKLHGYCQTNTKCHEDEKILRIFDIASNQEGLLKCNTTYKEKESTPSVTIPPIARSQKDTYVYYINHPSSEAIKPDHRNAAILRSWSSFGYWNQSHTPELTKCMHSNSTDIKFSALAALRSVSCDKYDYEKLLNLVKKSDRNPFLDIMRYLTLIRCPTTNLSAYLKQRLTSSNVNQETSFIWTHLSNLHGAFATDIIKDPTLTAKYNPEVLKFSRNFKKSFECMNKTYTIDLSVAFTGNKLKPQYLYLNIATNDTPIDLLNVEMYERNTTHGYLDKENSLCVTNVKAMGNLVYTAETDVKNRWFDFDMISLYMNAISYGFSIFSLFSFSYLRKLFGDNDPINYLSKDMLLQYPTSIGMPFHIKLNMTKGYVAEKSTLPSFSSKQCDIQMLIDATYTNVGTKVQTTWDILPGMNISSSDNSIHFIVDLPEKKSKLFDFNLGLFNIENERLSPRHYKGDTVIETMCMPLMKNLTGSTFCWEYCPQSNWWPVTRAQYSLAYVRDDNIRGHNLTFLGDDEDFGVFYEELGNPTQKWHFMWRALAQFANVKVRTPHFNLKGSGTFSSEVLGLEKPGQAMNISGLLSCNNEVAPFTLTGFNIVNKEKKENKFEVFFNSSLFESRIISTYENGDNCSVDATIPYRLKGKSSENVRMTLKTVEYNITETKSRWEMGASLGFSEYPTAVLAAVAFIDSTKLETGRRNIDVDLNSEISCTNHSLTAKAAAKWYPDFGQVTSSINYGHNNKTANWTETFIMENINNQLVSKLLCNNQVVYEMDANCGIGMMTGMYSNLTFVMPLEKEKYPFLQIDVDQNIDFFQQQFHLICRKSYLEKKMKLNITAGLVLDQATGLPSSFKELMHHRGTVELLCDKKDPFRVDIDSRLSNSLQDLDLTVDVMTPFQRWDKEAFKLKLEKTGSSMKTSLLENRRNAPAKEYKIQGSADVDVFDQLLDFTMNEIGEDYSFDLEVPDVPA